MGPLELDHSIFKFINEYMSNLFIDIIMLTLSDNVFYIVLGVAIVYVAYKTNDRRIIYALCVAVVAAIVTDLFVYEILKPFFARYRPCQDSRQIVRAVAGCAGRFGFPSNHATNSMAVATTVWIIAGKKWGLFAVLMAFLIGLSRIYLGMHYPFDILGGYVVGIIFALAVYVISRPISKIVFGKVL